MHGRIDTRPRSPRRAGQEGLALPTVLIIGVVLFMVITAVALRSVIGIQQADRDRKNNEALHIADGAIDKALFNLVEDRGFVTQSGANLDTAGPSSADDERAWALTKAQAKTAVSAANPTIATDPHLANVIKTNKGEWAVVKPGDRDIIYAVGWVPSRANAKHTRVLRIEYDFPPFNAINAILTGGNMQIGGSAKILGSAGSVHTNGSFDYTGGGWDVDGSVSASGGFPSTMPSQIGDKASSGGGKPVQDVPDIDPSDYYDKSMYDLCPDGTVRYGPSSPITPNTSGTPCTGSVSASNFGWSATVGTTTVWKYNSSICNNGVFYAHWSNVSITGNPGRDVASCSSQPWLVTIFAAAKRTSGQSCPNTGGDINIKGTPNMAPYFSAAPILLMAGRDFIMQGNASGATFTGSISVHEQFDMSGNMALTGNLIANDNCDTSGSPVAQNVMNLSGSSTITFNEAAELPLGKLIRITRWTEL